MKSNDKEVIEAKTKALAEASHKVAEKMYASAQPEQPRAEPGATGDAGKKADDGNVVDAEFEEVKSDKK